MIWTGRLRHILVQRHQRVVVGHELQWRGDEYDNDPRERVRTVFVEQRDGAHHDCHGTRTCPAPGVGRTLLNGGENSYRFRYNGLRPLLYANDPCPPARVR